MTTASNHSPLPSNHHHIQLTTTSNQSPPRLIITTASNNSTLPTNWRHIQPTTIHTPTHSTGHHKQGPYFQSSLQPSTPDQDHQPMQTDRSSSSTSRRTLSGRTSSLPHHSTVLQPRSPRALHPSAHISYVRLPSGCVPIPAHVMRMLVFKRGARNNNGIQ